MAKSWAVSSVKLGSVCHRLSFRFSLPIIRHILWMEVNFCISSFVHLCGEQTGFALVRTAHLQTPVSRAITQSFWSINCSTEHCYRPSHLGQGCWFNSSPLGHRWPMVGYSNIIWLRDNCDPIGQPRSCFANSHCPEGVDLPGCLSIQSYWDNHGGPSWSRGF